MKYYSREFYVRKVINRFGKFGFVLVTEYVKTNNIDKFNYHKKVKFSEDSNAKKFLYHKEVNKVYQVDKQ